MYVTLSHIFTSCDLFYVNCIPVLSCITVHPTPELPRLGLFFSYRCLVFPQKNVLKRKPEYFRDIQVNRPENVFFQHIYSNPILTNLTFLDNDE